MRSKAKFRRVIQLVAAFHEGDATGNQVMLLERMFSELGYEAVICSPTIDESLKGRAVPLEKFADIYDPGKDLIWMHYNLLSPLSMILKEAEGAKILQYHNVTPYHYFMPYNSELAELLYKSKLDLIELKDSASLTVADSQFNCTELRECGYPEPVHFPLVFDPGRLSIQGSPTIEKMYNDDVLNILFVGRIVPNKKLEDLIRFFAVFKRKVRASCRLIIAGKYDPRDGYFLSLIRIICGLRLDGVYFTGPVTQEELVSYYRSADIFISFSEHEGFFMPVLEAYYFSLPVMARNAAAVGETAGGGAMLFDLPDPVEVSLATEELIKNQEYRSILAAAGKQRIEDFHYDKIKKKLSGIVNNL